MAVCADTSRPSHPQAAADRGARTYFTSMFVIPTELERDTANLRTYAVRHSMAVAFANYGGQSGGLASGGGSTIWSERGEPVAQLGAGDRRGVRQRKWRQPARQDGPVQRRVTTSRIPYSRRMSAKATPRWASNADQGQRLRRREQRHITTGTTTTERIAVAAMSPHSSRS